MKIEHIKSRLIEIIEEIQENKEVRHEITENTDIIRDLAFDSLELFELMEKIKEEWGMNLFEEEDFMEMYQNFGLLVERIFTRNTTMI